MKRALLATAIALGIVNTSGAAVPKTPADVDGARIVAADREPGNWMSHGRTYDEQRYSPLTRITDGNVGKLGVAWTYKLDIDRGVESTAIVVDGVMYTTGAQSIVYALDARNGKLLGATTRRCRATTSQGCCDTVNRGVARLEGRSTSAPSTGGW